MLLQIVTLFAVTLSIKGDVNHAISEQKVLIRQPQNHNARRIHYGHKRIEHHEEYAGTYPSYEFSYKISDPDSMDMKGQHESRDGNKVKGTYWLVEPTGHKRTVKYTSDHDEGFKAKIRYSGSKKHNIENKSNENDTEKQNNNSQNVSKELIENSDEKRDDTVNKQIIKISKVKENQIVDKNRNNGIHKTKLQMHEQIQNNGFEQPDENNEGSSQEVDSERDASSVNSSNNNEESSDVIGEEAGREIEQMRHRIHKNYNDFLHAKSHNNNRQKNIKSPEEIRIVYKVDSKTYEPIKQTDNEQIKPVIEETSSVDENVGLMARYTVKSQINNKRNRIKGHNKSRASNNDNSSMDKNENQSNQREGNENVTLNSNNNHRDKANRSQSMKRYRENNRISKVRNNLPQNNENIDNSEDQGVLNKALLNNNQPTQKEEYNESNQKKLNGGALEDNREIINNAGPIMNIKNSKNNNKARANYYKQPAEKNNNKHSSNKEDNTEEEIFEHHIVVFHS